MEIDSYPDLVQGEAPGIPLFGSTARRPEFEPSIAFPVPLHHPVREGKCLFSADAPFPGVRTCERLIEPDPQLRGGEQPHVDDRLPGSIDGLLDGAPEHLCIDPAEIRLHRDDEHPSEVDRGGTDTHGPVFRGEVAGRAVGLARNDEGAEQCPGAAVSGRLPPAEDIELRLAGGRTDGQGTEHSEECSGR